MGSVLLTSVGCIGTVSLVAFIANQARRSSASAALPPPCAAVAAVVAARRPLRRPRPLSQLTVGHACRTSAQADPAERGALLGAVETLQELMEAVGHSGYGRLFALCISEASPLKLPGSPFFVASGLLVAALATIKSTFAKFPAAAASFLT